MASQIEVLVTGCGGFIGKYLIQRLLQNESVLVYGVDRQEKLDAIKSSSFIPVLAIDRFIPLNIDLTKQKECLDLPEVDFVYHLAAINGTSLFQLLIAHRITFAKSFECINCLNGLPSPQITKSSLFCLQL